jgi:hypothetical protein
MPGSRRIPENPFSKLSRASLLSTLEPGYRRSVFPVLWKKNLRLATFLVLPAWASCKWNPVTYKKEPAGISLPILF